MDQRNNVGASSGSGAPAPQWRPPPPAAPPQSEHLGNEHRATATSSTERVCPACAETVRAEAFVCRFCRYDLRSGRYADARPSNNGLAVASLTLALVALMIFPLVPLSALGALLALVMGMVAKRQIKRSDGAASGSEMARFGVLLGLVGLLVAGSLTAVAYAFDITAVSVNLSGF